MNPVSLDKRAGTSAVRSALQFGYPSPLEALQLRLSGLSSEEPRLLSVSKTGPCGRNDTADAAQGLPGFSHHFFTLSGLRGEHLNCCARRVRFAGRNLERHFPERDVSCPAGRSLDPQDRHTCRPLHASTPSLLRRRPKARAWAGGGSLTLRLSYYLRAFARPSLRAPRPCCCHWREAEASTPFIGAVIDTLASTPTPGGLAEGERL